jgi:hypothetical protein
MPGLLDKPAAIGQYCDKWMEGKWFLFFGLEWIVDDNQPDQLLAHAGHADECYT